ncbi:HAD family hydrolase [Flavobacterium turcicum]|uniref:HAD family phosphatase n=1 Tax=Flavobacterium turcicum TaxID=2764718 RepID=A0ABR7JJ01_9FLAO|nr:HAD family phosphatase [Flavobacterium turcicum]MBC5864455.1 HAD family phosphatase [Flavobacterium turcicum]NHL03223.1 HAD family phosphatase [Flavobacterium turcicum]
MIQSIIFDFGDIFINLDKQAILNALQKLGLQEWNAALDELNEQFERGEISRNAFLQGLQQQLRDATQDQILAAWNAVLLDFPQHRLTFLQELSKKYRLFLLSNTDSIHISYFEQQNGKGFYEAFYNCFEKIYFSFEMVMRKPDSAIYQRVLDEQKLDPATVLFVDDKKENTDAAAKLGIKVWNLQVGQEDVTELYEKDLL